MHEEQEANINPVPAKLGSLFCTFLKIGFTAFGGFMALISVVQNYVVDRKKLLKQEDMLDGVSLATILPGPVAVNVVAFVGYRLRGRSGALVCAAAVTLPAFLLLVALSYAYFRFGHLPVVGRFFLGFIPAVAAIILAAAWNMGTKAVKQVPEAIIAAAAGCLLLAIGGFLVTLGVLAVSGLSGWVLFYRMKRQKDDQGAGEKRADQYRSAGPPVTKLRALALPLTSAAIGLPAAGKLLIVFGGMSLLLFGGGYVFIPLIQRIVVDGYGWVTHQEFIDAIALGQITPGPILISAAFIGFKVAGLAGAAAATIGIFTPPALVMLFCSTLLDRIKRSESIKASLRGIRAAVVGMIGAAGITVARSAPLNWVSLLIFGASLVALLRFRVETAYIIPVAGLAGFFL